MMDTVSTHHLDGRSNMAMDFFQAKARGDKLSFIRLLDTFMQREYEAMASASLRMLEIVCSGAGRLTPNHRLRDFALCKFRYDEMHRLDSRAMQLIYEDAGILFDMLHDLFDSVPRGFQEFWDKLQLHEAIATYEEVAAAREALCSPGEDFSGERLVQWQKLTQAEQAHVLREKREANAWPRRAYTTPTLKQLSPDDPAVQQLFKQELQCEPTPPTFIAHRDEVIQARRPGETLQETAQRVKKILNDEMCKTIPLKDVVQAEQKLRLAPVPNWTPVDAMSERTIEQIALGYRKG